LKHLNWYITYNEPPNGLYESQVAEVVAFVDRELHKETRLVSFVSLRHYRRWKKDIRQMAPTAVVLPCLPAFLAYKWHHILLIPFLLRERPRKVICRGSFATVIGVGLKTFAKCRVVMDARGLLYEEDREYGIFPLRMSKSIRQLEIDSLRGADEVTAVTSDMYDYWKSEYGISFPTQVVIPCTVSDKLLKEIGPDDVAAYRARLKYTLTDVVLVYSGSTAPWQSLGKLVEWLKAVMVRQANVKTLFLCKPASEIDRLSQLFPGRVSNLFVNHNEVPYYLACADYGLLLRSHSKTNSVGSPIKTAEYLLAGLGIITNRNMAVHRLIESENLGIVVDDFAVPQHLLDASGETQRDHYRAAGLKYFSKNSTPIRLKYEQVYG